MGKIESIPKEETINFEDKVIENFIISRSPKKDIDQGIMDQAIGRFLVTGKNKILINKIIEYIQSAQELICISSFILTEENIIEEIRNSSQKGRRVYILTAPETQLQKENPEVDIQKDDYETHKKILNELAGLTLIRTAPHLHSKFILIDPKSNNAKGILSTANFTERELTRNPDIGVILNQNEIKDLFRQFIRAFRMESEREILEKGSLSAIGTSPFIEKQLKHPDDVLVTMKNKNTLKEGLSNLLDKLNPTTDEIFLSIFTIHDDFDLSQKLLALVGEGLKATIFTRFRSANLSALSTLKKAGATVLIHDRVHAKAIVVKANKYESILMTANFSELGLKSGFESGLKFNQNDSDDLMKILSSWSDKFPFEFHAEKLLKELPEKIYLLDSREGRIGCKILPHIKKNLGSMVASSIELMNEMKPSKFPEIEMKNELYRKCIYEWKVEAPRLPDSAKKIDIDTKTNLSVYSTKKTKYIVISDAKDLKKAEKIAKEYGCKIVLHAKN